MCCQNGNLRCDCKRAGELDPWRATRNPSPLNLLSAATRNTGGREEIDTVGNINAIAPGHYRHYKGGEYEVLHLARHSETEEELVVYRALTNGSIWVRPLVMFTEMVAHDGRLVPRFVRVSGGHTSSP
jgi:hypothetical protein